MSKKLAYFPSFYLGFLLGLGNSEPNINWTNQKNPMRPFSGPTQHILHFQPIQNSTTTPTHPQTLRVHPSPRKTHPLISHIKSPNPSPLLSLTPL